MRKKSQASIEFLFAIGIIFFVFLIIFGFMIDRNKELRDSNIEVNKRYTCLLISSLVTSAFVNGDGVIINMPIDYNATINATVDYKEVNVENMNCWLSVHTVPTAKLRKGIIEIENINNYIDIDNV